jgi:hypothetical protein
MVKIMLLQYTLPWSDPSPDFGLGAKTAAGPFWKVPKTPRIKTWKKRDDNERR